MSAWTQAAWAVNQIKNTITKDYMVLINGLITRYNTFVEDMNTKVNSSASSFVCSVNDTLPQDGVEKGSLCFLIQED